MSGTSIDNVDAALISVCESDFKLLATCSVKYENDLRDTLLALKSNPDLSLDKFIEIDHRVALAFAEATNTLLQQSNYPPTAITAIGSHGQTVYHLPQSRYPGTLQLGDPSLIAALTGIDVVADFRRADMAAGGQGAPLAPAFHQFALGSNGAVVLNLGGIANITVLNATPIGFDTGPANSILDECTQTYCQTPFDRDGAWARGGQVNQSLLGALLDDPYFKAQPPKSTGTEYFNLRWVHQHVTDGDIDPQNLQRTLLELTAVTVADSINRYNRSATIYVCGGGIENTFLIERIRHHLPEANLQPLDDAGVSADACECCTFAWLAYRHRLRLPGNIPEVTGARKRVVLGALYPKPIKG